MAASSPDLPDRRLIVLTIAAVTAIAAWFALVWPWLDPVWRTPGSPELYLAGFAGALLLLVPAAFALDKRTGSQDPRGSLNAHVYCALAGAVLVAVHSGGFLRRPPALLLAAIVALAALGVWARVRGARRMAATFASKTHVFPAPDAATRQRLMELIEEKKRILKDLDPDADEGTFSVTLAQLRRHPRPALAYWRLAREESRLLGTRKAAGAAQAWWRPLHIALAWIFALGVAIHLVTVTFFAGFVAGGRPINWWHLAAWGAGW